MGTRMTSMNAGSGRTVLIVEDDGCLRSCLATALAGDYQVQTAGSGAEALQYLRQHRADAVLLDIVMPDGDGFAVLSHIAAMEHRPQVVVLSAIDQVAKAVKAMRLGASDYLVKPCALDKVRSVLQRLRGSAQIPA